MSFEDTNGDVVTSVPDTWIPGDQVKDMVNPYLLRVLRVQQRHQVQSLSALDLLSPARIDILAKYIYALNKRLGSRSMWGVHVYREHLRVWNEFEEGDQSGKSSFESFSSAFDELLDIFGVSGFDSRLGLIPVGNDNIVIDGAHRVAAALCFDSAVKVVQFETQAARYDYRYFRARGLDAAILDDMVLHYCALDQRMRVAVLFPVASGRDGEVERVIEETGSIVYEKSVSFTQVGRGNLIRLLYLNEPWLGDGIKPTPGLLHHVNNRFVGNKPLKFLFFIGDDAESNRYAKEKVRSFFNLGNDSIHIVDTHPQTVSVAESVLNGNSIHHLNHARPCNLRHFNMLFADYQEWMERTKHDRLRFCIDGSAVLSAYGLRDANDLDYLYLGESGPDEPTPLIACHNSQSEHYGAPIDDLVMDPRNYFFHRGCKFLALHVVRDMKSRRNESKDVGDVHRIDTIEGSKGLWGTAVNYYYTLPERVYSLRFRLLRTVKRVLPKPLLPIAQAIYRMPRLIKVWLGPIHRNMKYRGFELHYSRGTSLAEGIQGGSIYEPEVATELRNHLRRVESPTYLDIGANLGLMTMNVLADIPDARVFAFEPGPHQATLLQKNIDVNGLNSRVSVIRSALSNRVGEAEFVVHRAWHSSGDGFFDTKRAGHVRKIRVPVTTLDTWWRLNGEPAIHAIKIDTEGAELWVLEGGEALIRVCQPVILFELHRKNIQAYPYQPLDVLNCLLRYGYSVRSLTGAAISNENLERYMVDGNDYVAIPTNA